MTDTTNPKLCQEVEDNIASVVDGDVDARLLEHIAECDRCRDLRFDAMNAAKAVRDAGGDYVHPDDFEQKLLERLDAVFAAQAGSAQSGGASASPSELSTAGDPAQAETRPAASPVTEPVETESCPAATVIDQPAVPAASRDAAGPSTGTQPMAVAPSMAKQNEPSPAVAASVPEPSSSATRSERSSQPPAPSAAHEAGAKVATLVRRKRGASIALGLVGATALGAAAAFAIYVRSNKVDTTAAADGQPWTGRIAAVRHAGPDSQTALQRCAADGSGCAPVAKDAEVPAGSLIRTDGRTRAHLELSDGTTIALDRSTEFVVSVRDGRVAEVRRGVVVADVQHLDQGANARFELPSGSVEVIGTKLAMTAGEDRSSVEVIRGAVKLSDKRGESVVIRAGEEGVVGASGGPSVSPVTDLSDGVVWSERGDVEEGPEDAAVRGLGELKARKPGGSGELNQAVRLTKHDVKVRVVGSVARTEIDETFSNETGDVLEGIYRFPLPPDAQIERLALEVDGHLEEGAFVDRDRAAAIWRGAIVAAAPKAPRPREEIVWVPGPWRDPALLEWQRGGRFELRIYPIPARGSRRVILAYTQTIAPAGGVRRYVYPLSYDPGGSTRVEDFNVDAQVRGHDPSFGVRARGYEMTSRGDADSGAKVLSLSARSFVPSGDLTLEFALPEDKQEVTAWAYQPTSDMPAVQPSDDAKGAARPGAKVADTIIPPVADGAAYVAITVRPKLPRWTEGKMRDQVIVVDSSRSMVGERYKRASKLAESIVREMDRRDRFALLACDISCVPMDRELAAPGGSAPQRVRDFLSRIEPEGGTDVVEAVRRAREMADGSSRDRELRIIYVGDGTPSVGPVRPPHIMSEVSRVLPPGSGMLTAVAVGSDADAQALAAMARGGGGVMIPYVPGERLAGVAIRVLGASYGIALRNPVIELPEGLTDVHPRVIDNVPAGGETIVVARMTRPSLGGSIKLKGQVGGEAYEQTYPIELSASGAKGNSFVPRLYAATKIADLEANQGENAKQELIDLSKRFAVASRYTSLLVLESAAMFRAFGLDRYGSGTPAWTGEEGTVSTGADGLTRYEEAEGDEEAKGKSESRERGDMGAGASPSKKDKANAYPGAAMDDAFDGPAGGRAAESTWSAPPPAATGTASPPRSSPRRPATMAGCAPGDLACAMNAAARDREPPPRSGNWVPMRRVWDRKGEVSSDASSARAKISQQLVEAESEASANPDSRTKLEKLLGLYAISGQIDRASEIADRWSSRDALDPGALVARAELSARKGDRARAIRILSGMADVRPGDTNTQNWLATLFESMGEAPRACSFRIALADMRSSDAPSLASAIRCARSTGRGELGESLLRNISKDSVRNAMDAELAKSVPAPALRGDLRVEASWDADADLDIALIGKKGERYSWLGDPRGKVTSRDATSRRSEALAVFAAPAGDYIIEVTRADGSDAGVPLRGSVTVSVAGVSRTLPFTLSGVRTEVGSARVFFTSRLVPVNDW